MDIDIEKQTWTHINIQHTRQVKTGNTKKQKRDTAGSDIGEVIDTDRKTKVNTDGA